MSASTIFPVSSSPYPSRTASTLMKRNRDDTATEPQEREERVSRKRQRYSLEVINQPSMQNSDTIHDSRTPSRASNPSSQMDLNSPSNEEEEEDDEDDEGEKEEEEEEEEPPHALRSPLTAQVVLSIPATQPWRAETEAETETETEPFPEYDPECLAYLEPWMEKVFALERELERERERRRGLKCRYKKLERHLNASLVEVKNAKAESARLREQLESMRAFLKDSAKRIYQILGVV